MEARAQVMSGRERLQAAAARLRCWLMDDALPIWWERGADPAGGFCDRLDQSGAPSAPASRLRVQARQTHVYALAARMGWSAAAEAASRHGLAAVRAARGDDGLYRLGGYPVAHDGMGLVYDQAFVLLALASYRAAFGGGLEAEAAALARRLEAFADPAGGYGETPGLAAPLFANPNMHLFEAFQAWSRASDDPLWPALADAEARLCLERLVAPGSGALHEVYDAGWRTPADAVCWPGHLYEWGFLLLDWPGADGASRAAALRLIDVAERHGVDQKRGVAIFAQDGALAPLDSGARLWAQTERARACARAAGSTGDATLWDAAAQAAEALEGFLQVPTPGLWRDWMDETGAYRDEPAPASSLYHIVGAIAELTARAAGPA